MAFFSFFQGGFEPDPKGFPQQELIAAVHLGGIPMERMTSQLIDYFKGYQIKFMKMFGLDKEEAIDAYTDAVVAVINYIRLDAFDESHSISTLLFKVTKNKSIDCLRKKGRGKELEKEEISIAEKESSEKNPLYELLLTETMDSVLDLLDRFQGKCREIILKWGFWGYSMAEIAESLQLKNADVARQTKSRCLKKLKKGIQDNPDFPNPNFD